MEAIQNISAMAALLQTQEQKWGGQPAVTVQLMCVDSAGVIYSLFFGSAVLTNELQSASGTQQIMHAAQAHQGF